MLIAQPQSPPLSPDTPTATANSASLTAAASGTPVQTDPTFMQRRTVTIIQATTLVGVSRRTIYNWLKAGKVEHTRTAGGSVRIYADSLMKG